MKLSLVAAIASLSLISPALAQTYELYKQEGGWNVFHNTTTNGCFMERVTDDGFVLQIGSLQSMVSGEGETVGGFMAVYAPGDPPASAGGDPDLALRLGPNVYMAKAHSVQREDRWGGYFVSDGDADLASDLINRREMEIFTSNGSLVKIDINRTGFAMDEAVRATQVCQDKYN